MASNIAIDTDSGRPYYLAGADQVTLVEDPDDLPDDPTDTP